MILGDLLGYSFIVSPVKLVEIYGIWNKVDNPKVYIYSCVYNLYESSYGQVLPFIDHNYTAFKFDQRFSKHSAGSQRFFKGVCKVKTIL